MCSTRCTLRKQEGGGRQKHGGIYGSCYLCQKIYMFSCMYNMCTSIYTKFLYGWCFLLFILVSDDVMKPIPIPKIGLIRVRVSQNLHDRFYYTTTGKRAPQNPKSAYVEILRLRPRSYKLRGPFFQKIFL